MFYTFDNDYDRDDSEFYDNHNKILYNDQIGHPGFMTIDNRTRSLIVSQPPEGFDASALEHFSRLVLVLIITDDPILIVYFVSSIIIKSCPYFLISDLGRYKTYHLFLMVR
jgi:hypothetical protein